MYSKDECACMCVCVCNIHVSIVVNVLFRNFCIDVYVQGLDKQGLCTHTYSSQKAK